MNYFQLSVIMPYKKWNSASFNGYMHAYLFLSAQHINPVRSPSLNADAGTRLVSPAAKFI